MEPDDGGIVFLRKFETRHTTALRTGNLYKKYFIDNITAKAALKFGSEAWVLKKREEQRLEAA